MKILIASGIYPPDIGGPAQYARNLYETWKKQGHDVKVAAYRWERIAPPGLRHFLYLTKIIRKGWNADLILVLDTWSAAVPTLWACKLMRKKYIIRTGGDFLWETYVERTGDLVRFKDFYPAKLPSLTMKERLVYDLGGRALRNASAIIFSTEWQKKIFEDAYELDKNKNYIVLNHFGEKRDPAVPEERSFVAGSRFVKLKNMDMLESAFEEARLKVKQAGFEDIQMDTGKAVYDSFVEKIRNAYCVIVPSISEISPNIIADAISVGTPYILTKENGLDDEINKAGVLIDPMDKNDMAEKILWMSDPENRKKCSLRVSSLSIYNSWDMIAKEIQSILEKIQYGKKTS